MSRTRLSDFTLTFHIYALEFDFSLLCTGEGNGNPLQSSCLENPRDGGAWWAATYGLAESDTTEATLQQQLVVQRLRPHTSTVGSIGSIPGPGTNEIPHGAAKIKKMSF